jgi:hypothetical protein
VAVRVIEGFESGDLDTLWGVEGTQFADPTRIDTDTVGYWSRFALKLGSTVIGFVSASVQIPTAPSEIYGAIRTKLELPSDFVALWSFRSPNDVQQCRFEFNGSGFVRAVRGDGTVLATSSTAIEPSILNTWGSIWEWRVLIADSGGRMALKHNGTTYLDFTGDTRNDAGSSGIATFVLLRQASWYDDLIIYDTTGSRNNSWVGEKAVDAMRPSGQGDAEQLNRSPSEASLTRAYYGGRAWSNSSFTPAPAPGWERQGIYSRYHLEPTKKGTAFATKSANPSHFNGEDILVGQFISPPVAAQTITGTVKGQIRVREGFESQDLRAQLVIRVIAPDGTVRGTLVDFSTNALSSEFAADAGLPNRKFPLAAISPVTMTSVAAQAGDRIVVEVGARAHATGGGGPGDSIQFRFGDASATDLAEDETTTQDHNPWIEFSNSITLQNDNWEVVSEDTPADDDASYVQDTVVNDYDLYHFEDLDGVWGVVDAVAVTMRTRAVEPGGAKVAAVLKSGGVENTSSDQAISPVYDWFSFLYDQDPTDSNAWTPSKVNNLQAGPKIR